MKDGVIHPDSKFGKKIGFTSDKFDGYLWKLGDYIYISFIISKQPNQGNLSKLFNNILNTGHGVKVPTPIGKMEIIVRRKGFIQTYEWDDVFQANVEVWIRDSLKEGRMKEIEKFIFKFN